MLVCFSNNYISVLRGQAQWSVSGLRFFSDVFFLLSFPQQDLEIPTPWTPAYTAALGSLAALGFIRFQFFN